MNSLVKQAGFTLAECLTILAIMAILTTLAITQGGSWFTQQQSKAFVDQLVHELQYARQQAILRKARITICPTLDFVQCADNEAWQNGYLIFVNAGELLTLTHTPKIGLLTNTRDYVQFDANGSTPSTNSTFIYMAGDKTYRVIINLQGRIRVEE